MVPIKHATSSYLVMDNDFKRAFAFNKCTLTDVQRMIYIGKLENFLRSAVVLKKKCTQHRQILRHQQKRTFLSDCLFQRSASSQDLSIIECHLSIFLISLGSGVSQAIFRFQVSWSLIWIGTVSGDKKPIGSKIFSIVDRINLFLVSHPFLGNHNSF